MKIAKLFSYFLIIAFVGLATVSCLDDDTNQEFLTYGYVPGTEISYNLDSVQPVNKPTKFEVKYTLTGNCQEFIEFRKLNSSTTLRTDVGVFASQKNNAQCTNDLRIETKTFTVTPREAGENTVRVWAGKNELGEDIFISQTFNVPAE
ncbi:MAG TPA: hypothetical protein VIG94_08945 [Faecalibacter sp.]|uniref:hypothetical protein n=1 Tax=Faecalibacter sp. LW9 TaxID=3103144 RepID=UPI002AFE80FE|nr:hypothetical protein [Faecalibacter sp. LW9]